MASIIIRNIEEGLKGRLRVRAAEHGRSMEDEVREILKAAMARERGGPVNLAATIRARFGGLGTFVLPEIPRETLREPPEFD